MIVSGGKSTTLQQWIVRKYGKIEVVWKTNTTIKKVIKIKLHNNNLINVLIYVDNATANNN